MEDYFRLMVENSDDILTIRDADGRIRYTSPAMQRVMGYTQEEMVGSTGFDLIHPEDRDNVLRALHEFMRAPGKRDSIQYRARHADGGWVSLEVVAYNLLDDPEVRGLVINGRDIDENGVWEQIEIYLRDRAEIEFSHGACPDCTSHWLPEDASSG